MVRRAANKEKKGSFIKPDQIITINSTLKYAIYDISLHYDSKGRLNKKYKQLEDKTGDSYATACKYDPKSIKELGLDPKSPQYFIVFHTEYSKLSPMVQQLIFYHEEGHIVESLTHSSIEVMQTVNEIEANMYAFEKLEVTTIDKAVEYIGATFKDLLPPDVILNMLFAIYRLMELGKII